MESQCPPRHLDQKAGGRRPVTSTKRIPAYLQLAVNTSFKSIEKLQSPWASHRSTGRQGEEIPQAIPDGAVGLSSGRRWSLKGAPVSFEGEKAPQKDSKKTKKNDGSKAHSARNWIPEREEVA